MQDRNRLRKWWLTEIRPKVAAEDGDPRDFLALERTFLAYVRTANALASFAIVAAQLFILHHDSVVAGKMMGAMRYFKQQRSLQRRKCYIWNPESIRVALLFFVWLCLDNPEDEQVHVLTVNIKYLNIGPCFCF
ncbi:hypothetical protein BDV27DRAFT_148376 [Aspergillus caelatus]|uniref:DUF202 domain-containing protein n=1 Tax=Aspergillus caelatus TaxID=61420 RepID=A0A5N6ZV51_9EURO|nr:uncharacterized protein BDV27DRAFT_148376 [Aspergillus caelatus]KAE8360816.1 hypothetical protein BDV27DRAFT_148376 [Aspergillus caelatus]